MTIKVKVERPLLEKEMNFSGSFEDLMKKLGVNKETVIISRNGELATEDELVEKGDDIVFVSVVSGG